MQFAQVVENIRAGGSTALWKGLHAGLESLRAEGDKDRMAHLLLLTDGESDEGPDKVMASFNAYRALNEKLPGTISTFGFGNNACSPLLFSIANLGSGSFAFIPDAGFVGTVFVNALSNCLCSAARHAQLTLEAGTGSTVLRASGGWVLQPSGDFHTIDLGVLQFDQSRDVVLRMKIGPRQPGGSEPYLFATLSYCNDKSQTINVTHEGRETTGVHAELVNQQQIRCSFVDLLMQILEDTKSGPDGMKRCGLIIQEFAEYVQSSKAAANDAVKGLLEDCVGQTALAVSKDQFWSTWGNHYVRSLCFAHKLQQCNNFKDAGVQHYGGALFKELQEVADSIFNGLPPPVSSNRTDNYIMFLAFCFYPLHSLAAM